ARTLARCAELGLVHRDVKPGNVLFDAEGRPLLADFGCVRDLAALPLTGAGAGLGDTGYMAVEQLEGAAASPAADVHALGAVLYELLSGRRPRLATTAEAALERARAPAPAIEGDHAWPPALDALLARALAPDAAARPSAAALADALESIAAPASGRLRRGARAALA